MLRFKHLAVALVVLVAAVVIRNNPVVNDWVRKALIPFKVARLYMAPPDAALRMPVEGVAASSVADTWGAPRPGERRHEGQDIFAPKGRPVVAATRGYITRMSDGGIGGIAVFVTGAGGRVYYYAHLSAYAPNLETGQEVRPGDLLGLVGNTGNARTTPPHLHFGIYGAAGAIDPLPLLQAGSNLEPSAILDPALAHRP